MEERKNFHCERIGVCSKCGEISAIEIHHKIPLAIGGTNNNDNLICLCEKCHKEVHKSNRSELIKAGQKKKSAKQFIIGYADLYEKIVQLIIDSNGNAKAYEVLDIIENMDKRRNARKNDEAQFERIEKSLAHLEQWLASS
jgi:hypothetical protein